MKCGEIKDFFSRTDAIEKPIHKSIAEHINNCDECHASYAYLLFQEKIIDRLQKNSPSIPNPHALTQSIMEAVSEEAVGNTPLHSKKIRIRKISGITSRFLTAASIGLFILLGIEQFNFLQKTSKLEQFVDNTKAAVPAYMIGQQLLQHRNHLSADLFLQYQHSKSKYLEGKYLRLGFVKQFQLSRMLKNQQVNMKFKPLQTTHK